MKEKVFEFIKKFIEENGYSPTMREVCKGTGAQSTSTIFGHLQKLEGEGYIRYQSFKSRTIVILKDMDQSK